MKRSRRKADKTGRSVEDQYWNLPYTMMKSAAFRQLPSPALKVFMELRARYNGHNNGKITLSLDEAARLLGLSKSTAGRAFHDLETHGFIKLRVRGTWYGRKEGAQGIGELCHRHLVPNPAHPETAAFPDHALRDRAAQIQDR